ncbi:MAG TPA: efflux RND transporter periplasmic adaptor subunit [Hyphomonadaceae bacterium]|jgi:HlyD family secretion protein|nr:efflux RND transporter periplasmic adaptor subunit [Hyphomonadaceae bacterium]
MTRPTLKVLFLSAAAAMALASCGPPPANRDAPAPGAKGSKLEVDPKSINTPYAAISAGKVDVEGGLVDVAARSAGIIQEVYVQEGDKVKKNQILARQDDEDSRLSRDRSLAQLRQSEAQVPNLEVQIEAAIREEKRLKMLLDSNATSSQSWDQASDRTRQLKTQLDAQVASINLQKAALAEANYQVEQRVIRAPTDGTIVRRYANPGSGASTFNVTAMFQLQPANMRIVRAEVEERSLGSVKVGQPVEIVPESDQDKSYTGKVLRIAGVMGSRKLRSDDPSERPDERVVEVVVDAEQAPVLIGQRVLVKFMKDGDKSGEAAPKTADATPAKH